jgi:hypothetical protein
MKKMIAYLMFLIFAFMPIVSYLLYRYFIGPAYIDKFGLSMGYDFCWFLSTMILMGFTFFIASELYSDENES